MAGWPRDRRLGGAAGDGVELYVSRWSENQPLAVLIFVRGIAGHGGRFGETATDLRERSVAVYPPERRGNGAISATAAHLTRRPIRRQARSGLAPDSRASSPPPSAGRMPRSGQVSGIRTTIMSSQCGTSPVARP